MEKVRDGGIRVRFLSPPRRQRILGREKCCHSRFPHHDSHYLGHCDALRRSSVGLHIPPTPRRAVHLISSPHKTKVLKGGLRPPSACCIDFKPFEGAVEMSQSPPCGCGPPPRSLASLFSPTQRWGSLSGAASRSSSVILPLPAAVRVRPLPSWIDSNGQRARSMRRPRRREKTGGD